MNTCTVTISLSDCSFLKVEYPHLISRIPGMEREGVTYRR